MQKSTQTRYTEISSSMLLLGFLGLSGCGPGAADRTLTASVPLHLEEHLEQAAVTGSVVPKDIPQPVIWSFDKKRTDWKATPLHKFPFKPTELEWTDDALRVTLGKTTLADREFALGSIYIDVPDWTLGDWAHVQVRARTSDKALQLGLAFNLREETSKDDAELSPFANSGEQVGAITDGSVQMYSLRADWTQMKWEGKWRQLILVFVAEKPGSIDLLSVTVIPKEAGYANEPSGVREEIRNRIYRRALYFHAPGRVEYHVRVPESGRLDFGLGVLRDDYPMTFHVTAVADDGKPQALYEEAYKDKENWGQRSVDLSHLAGQTIRLSLEGQCVRAGAVALWGGPTLTGSVRGPKSNVIFYVIDGGAADNMSVYGYHRRTTPNLERLAAEGALFERAFSNSSWTKPSTASFMTSLQDSVMGGYSGRGDPVPDQVTTMAEHMHRAGYETGVFISNSNAGTLSNLQRGVDLMRESWDELDRDKNHKTASVYLQRGFWDWRKSYPGEPYWVHFQVTDVHSSFQDGPIPAPFSGLFVSPGELKIWKEWLERLEEEDWSLYSKTWEKTGIDRVALYTIARALYDQEMAHVDQQIGRLVERLRAEGEWDNTLLIVAADHSITAAQEDLGLALQEKLPPRWNKAIFRPSISRIPLLFVWPGRIKGGQRFNQPVSMIDVLPTILDLVDLEMPEVVMGQSLAPLLLGTKGWEPRPVVFDEFTIDPNSGELRGTIELVDGRWGASLEINPKPPEKGEDNEAVLRRRPVPLLLYDLWEDYYCLNSIHEKRPDLVKTYTAFLQERWKAHQALAKVFSRSSKVPLDAKQLETLRSLGYIR